METSRPPADRAARLRRLRRGTTAAAVAGFAALVGLAATGGHTGGGNARATATPSPQPASSEPSWPDDGYGSGSSRIAPATGQAPAAVSGAS